VASGAGITVYYDGRCGICDRFRRTVLALDRDGEVEAVALQDAHARGNHLGLDEETFWSQFHVELPDGTVRSGADALAPLLDRLVVGGPLAWCLRRLPPARWLARGLYGLALRYHGGPAQPWDRREAREGSP
jgi:predicted DCC family thiol-disulfide oxidoreductase YuxK